ncbi:LysR family transcriptional regulator [Azospirillum picis]|uniref:DNA-binding transcriptional LysR family regulator n=1 Tax=Azospirillum picis TaxID=488438 RepID=A0ABU0MI45_9PROT|nr:LysR family transcriptional regulator [Azospirillum picis]MBP2299318.1 DNA-binding transcriptional LysR family regulator [Azospirillum picis]MDQ0533044.1 DNA-binding transcriptional LysR family regulator [Azospirillum picis]
MDRLDDMLAFIKVVDTKSFTAAADRLNLSKSVVSRRIGELENRLGARLLNRTTRKLSLTEVGQAYYERCTRILADLEEAEQAVADLHAAPRGRLRLNAPVSFGILHLAPAVAEFLERYPAIEIDMDLNDRYVDLIDEGYDMAIRIGRLRDSSLIARRLAPARMALCASPAYLKAHGIPQTPEDLTQHRCLIYTNVPSPDLWQFTVDGELRNIRVSGPVRVNNGDLLREAAVAGLGFVILPTFLCGEALSRGELVSVLHHAVRSDLSVNAVYPQNRHLSPKVRVFVDFLVQRFGTRPYWDCALLDTLPQEAGASEQ